MFRSIRWRLVSSYALLTVLTVSLVGILTLSLVQRYLEHQEIEYLTANAESVAQRALPLLASNAAGTDTAPPPALTTTNAQELHPTLVQLVHTAAFLSNVQVRILDADGRVVADSGNPTELNEVAWLLSPSTPYTVRAVDTEAAAQPALSMFALPLTGEGQILFEDITSQFTGSQHEFLREGPAADTNLEGDVVIVRTSPSQWGSRVMFEYVSEAEAEHPGGATPRPFEIMHPDVVSVRIDEAGPGATSDVTNDDTNMNADAHTSQADAPAGSEAIGTVGSAETALRSQQIVRVPITDGTQQFGTVELSNGPNFSAESLATIRNAFLVAAGGVSVLSVIVGLLVGQGLTAPILSLAAATERMSGGDLSVRAAVRSNDEIGLLARQFNRMAARLEASFSHLAAERDALRRFIADASHELRTPITALKAFNELLQGSAASDVTAQAEFLRESERQIDKLDWITSNLLDLSRLDAGLVELDLARHGVEDVLAAVAAQFQVRAQDADIALSVQPPPQPIHLLCDRVRVELALTNLLDNAFKFTAAGGVIEIGGDARTDHVLLWVRDEGAGIAPQDLPHIFDRFYQGKGSPRGSGLGLAIVQSIVRAHGGAVRVHSTEGSGSCFEIKMPQHPTASAESDGAIK